MGNFITMGVLAKGAAAVVAGLAVIANLPTSLWLPTQKATLDYLATATLTTLDESKRKFQASELWKDKGAVIMAVRRPG